MGTLGRHWTAIGRLFALSGASRDPHDSRTIFIDFPGSPGRQRHLSRRGLPGMRLLTFLGKVRVSCERGANLTGQAYQCPVSKVTFSDSYLSIPVIGDPGGAAQALKHITPARAGGTVPDNI